MGKTYRKMLAVLFVIVTVAVSMFSTLSVSADSTPTIYGKAHTQKNGWMAASTSGTWGTTGKSLRLEAFQLSIKNSSVAGGITYRSYVQNSGWESSWKKDGETSGSTGKSLRIEAVQINLYGALADSFDVYYRAHTQKFGWLGWTKNGASAGTYGYNYRVEAIQVKLVKKGGSAPGSTSNSYRVTAPKSTTSGRYWVTSNYNFHTTQNTLGHYNTLDEAKSAISATSSSTRGQWYVYDRTDKKVVYPTLTTKQQKISFAVGWATAIANDNNHVYSSTGEGLSDNMSLSTSTNPGPERWGLHGNYACSTLIEMAYELAGYTNLRDICRTYQLRMNAYYGYRVGYNSTSMAKALLRSGTFTEITSSYKSRGTSALKAGDLLLTSSEGHAAMYIGNNRCVEAVGSGIIISSCGSRWGRAFRPST